MNKILEDISILIISIIVALFITSIVYSVVNYNFYILPNCEYFEICN